MTADSVTFLTRAYQWKWVTKTQLQAAVVAKTLTADQYKQITGEDYAAAGSTGEGSAT